MTRAASQSCRGRAQLSVVQLRRIVLPNNHGEKLVGILHETGSKELVIVCHGFQSSKDRIPMVNLAATLEREGISAFRFDFAGNGCSLQILHFLRDAYGESEGSFYYGNYSREAEDLLAVVQHFRGKERVINAIIGHSKGGNAVLLYAAKYNDIYTVINISGRFHLERGIEGRLGQGYLERIKQNGFIDVKNKKGKFEYRVTEESLMDRLTTDTRAACLTIHQDLRVMTIHGSMDKMVPAEDALEFDKFIPNHKLHIIQGADHEFTSHQDELTSLVLDFIRENHHKGGAQCKRAVDGVNSRM